MKKRNNIKGWKCFDADLSCKGFKFEVGKTYEHKGKVELCKSGFHFHEKGHELFNYYSSNSRVCEVVAHGVITEGDKSVCAKLEVVRELNYFYKMAVRYGYGYGYGDGYGDGYGYGYGDGNGDGDGNGNGDGNGDGYGYGNGNGDGNGNGYGNGYGYGDGYGYGYGNGYGYGYGTSVSYFQGFILKEIAA